MSDDGIHAHGAHDHALEEAGHGSAGSFAGRLAVVSAALATVGALMSYEGGATQSSAMMFKNEASIRKTEASNQWAYYQAKGQKQNLAQLGAQLAPASKERFEADAARYGREKEEIQKEARRLEELSRQADVASEQAMHRHHRWALGATLAQVGIALSAIALLTRRRWLCWGIGVVGSASLAMAALALLG